MAAAAKVRWGVRSTARINADVVPCLHRSAISDLVAVASRDRKRAERYAQINNIEHCCRGCSEQFVVQYQTAVQEVP